MKGFGINDVPPVVTAELGIALYSDTDVTKVTGGIIDLRGGDTAIDLGNKKCIK
jgi:cation transport ATPase